MAASRDKTKRSSVNLDVTGNNQVEGGIPIYLTSV